jgi:hypothetical protein
VLIVLVFLGVLFVFFSERKKKCLNVNYVLNAQVAMTSTSIRMTAEWSITTVCPKGRHPVVEAEEWVRRITTKRSWVWAE